MQHTPAVVRTTTRAAGVAELIWIDPRDPAVGLEATVGTPLLLEQSPVFAFTYAEYERAHRLAASGSVAVVFSDPRASGSRWRPLTVVGRPVLTPDPDGGVFTHQLLEQELRKYPPSRALADSMILRRENWWYLPRLLVTIEVGSVEPIQERAGGPQSAVLARLQDDLAVESITAADLERRLVDDPPGDADGLPALALGHDFTPDLEQHLRWSIRGRWVEGALRVQDRSGSPTAATGLTLWQRLVRHRDLGRDCRRNLPG